MYNSIFTKRLIQYLAQEGVSGGVTWYWYQGYPWLQNATGGFWAAEHVFNCPAACKEHRLIKWFHYDPRKPKPLACTQTYTTVDGVRSAQLIFSITFWWILPFCFLNSPSWRSAKQLSGSGSMTQDGVGHATQKKKKKKVIHLSFWASGRFFSCTCINKLEWAGLMTLFACWTSWSARLQGSLHW